MRRIILALLLCASPTAISQSIPQPPANSGKSTVEPGSRFHDFTPNQLTRPTMPVQTDPGTSPGWNSAQRNWKINPQQPWSLPGEQQFGKTLMAQNEHPDPQSLGPKVQPIPTQWPNAKMEPIPTRWPDFKLLPIATQAESPVMLRPPSYNKSK
jgi:hypothetical protein